MDQECDMKHLKLQVCIRYQLSAQTCSAIVCSVLSEICLSSNKSPPEFIGITPVNSSPRRSPLSSLLSSSVNAVQKIN